MAKYSNVVQYNIVTDVDSSGIVKLQNELTKLKQSLKFDKGSFSQLGFDDAKIEKSIQKVNQLQTAITAAFNPKIGTLDLGKLNTSLQKEHTSLQMIIKDWEQMGTRGTMAISNLSNALLSMNKGAMNVNTTLSKIANTFSNTVRWGITASIFQEMMSSVQGAVSYMKDLDESLTQIQMVTNSSKENMRELAQYANNAAQALGSTTVDYTNAVKVFVQEGFSESESKQYANLSTKLANVSEQSTAVTSDQITAFRNAFQLSYEETVAAMDKVANVANNTASNVNELMTASQRAASVAQAVGSSQESFLAAIATIESVTRQSAEEIGNGLKTIYQRFADIKVSGKTEDGVDYGQYANALKQIGVDVLDASGEFKGMDQILKETQEVWSSLSETMKVAVGEKVAGKFQYNRFAALMNNQQYYEKALAATGAGSEGMMDQMNEIYMESIEGRLNTLQAAGEQVMSTLFNQDDVEPVIENVTNIVNGLNNIVDAMGGLSGVLPLISALMLRTFSTPIAGTISNIATSIGTIIANSKNANQLSQSVELFGLKNYFQSDTNKGSVAGKLVSNVAGNYDQLSIGTQEKIRDLSQQIVELEEQKNNILKEQEQFFKQIGERAIEEQMLQEQKLEAQEKILEQKYKEGKLTEEQYQSQKWILEDDQIKLGIYEKLAEKVREYATQIANGNKANKEMIVHLQEMRKQASGLGINIAELESLIEQLGIAENNLSIGDKMVNDIVQISRFEATVNNAVKALSSLTSISFGISMIGEAFGTLADESASLKEKLDAVTINGLMGITMLVPGIMQGVTAVKELNAAWEAWKVQQVAVIAIEELFAKKQATNALLRDTQLKRLVIESIEQSKLNKEKLEATLIEAGYDKVKRKYILTLMTQLGLERTFGIVTTDQIAKTTLRTIVTEKLTAALVRLGIAEKFIAPIGIAFAAVTAAIIAATVILNQMAEAEEKRKQQLQEQLETSNQIIQTLNDTKDAYDEVYNSYKKTGVVSDDLKNKSVELAKALKIEGAEALANAGYYDELNQKIQEASIRQREYNTALLKQQVADLNKQNSISFSNEAIQEISQYGWDNSQYVKERLGTGTSGSENIKNKKEAILLAEKEIEIARKRLSLLDNTAKGYLTEKTKLEELIKTQQEYISQNSLTENEEKQVESSKNLAENAVAIYKDSGAFDNIKNYQDVINKLLSDENISEYLSLIGEEDAKVWIQAYTQEVLANKPVILKAYQDVLKQEQALQSFTQNLTDQISVSILQGLVQATDINGAKVSLTKEDAEGIVKEYTDAINNLDLSEDEKVQLMATLSDKSWQEIDEIISEVNATGSLEKLELDLPSIKDTINEMEPIDEDVDKDEFKALAQYLADAANELDGFSEELEENSEELAEVTEELLRYDSALEKAQEKLEEWQNQLSSGNIQDNAKAVKELTNTYNDLLDVGEDVSVSAGFAKDIDNLNLLQRVLEGDTDAYDELQRKAAEDIVTKIAVNDELALSALDNIYAKMEKIGFSEIEVGASINDTGFITALENMVNAAGMTAEEATSVLSEMGIDAEVEAEQQEIPEESSVTGWVPSITYKTWSANLPTTDIYQGTLPASGQIPVVTYKPDPISSITNKVATAIGLKVTGSKGKSSGGKLAIKAAKKGASGGIKYNNASHGTGSQAGSGGGGGSNKGSGSSSKPKRIDPKEGVNSEWNYLTDITNDLEREAAVLDKLTKLEDSLYGPSRISQLKKIQKEQQKRINLLEKEEKIAKRYAKRQTTQRLDENGNKTIKAYADKVGIGLKLDKQGNIDNGQQIEHALTDRINKAVNNWNAHRGEEDMTDYEKAIDEAKKDRDNFNKAFSEYENALSVAEKAQAEIIEAKEIIQDAVDDVIDAIQESLDEIVDNIKKRGDINKTYRDWLEGGNGYSHFNNQYLQANEGLQSFFSKTKGKSLLDREYENFNKTINEFKTVFDIDKKDKIKPEDEKLKQEDAKENLKQTTESMVKVVNEMIGYYDSLLTTIESASEKMDELIDNRIDQFDNLEKYLDTRLDQIKLLFGDKSYEKQQQIYEKKIEAGLKELTTINTAIVQEQAKEKTLLDLQSTDGELSTENLEALDNTRRKITQLQQKQLDVETQTLDEIKQKAVLQTQQSIQDLKNSIFNGIDADWIAQKWELDTRNSDKFLDDYNKAFEIQKLQLKFQDALNNSQQTSLGTQQKIVDLANEYLTYLRKREKTTQYDVDLAEKRLDILQKQIALEDAQNNKSQMRLQRNAAGNYDFVYTADEENVNNTLRDLLNAEQDAYNLSKQMVRETTSDIIQAFQTAEDMVLEILQDTSIKGEERKERIKYVMNSLQEYYNDSAMNIKEGLIDIYNTVADSEQVITEENQGKLAEYYDLMRKNSEAFKENIGNDFDFIQQSTGNSFENIKSQSNTTFGKITGDFIGINTSALNTFESIYNSGKINFENIEDSANESLNKIRKGTTDTQEAISTDITTITDSIGDEFDLVNQVASTNLGSIDSSFNETTDKIVGNNGYVDTFEEGVTKAVEAAGDSVDSFLTDTIDVANEALEELDETTDGWNGDLTILNTTIANSALKMKEWSEKIGDVLDKIVPLIDDSYSLIEQIETITVDTAELNRELEELKANSDIDISVDYQTNYTTTYTTYHYDDYSNSNGSGYSGNSGSSYGSGNNSSSSGFQGLWEAYDENGAGSQGGFSSKSAAQKWARRYSGWDNIGYRQYDTGGYTGIWPLNEGIDDKNGKLAILHQKELVLNQTDTENMLSAVEVVRDIMSNLNSLSSFGKNFNQSILGDNIQQRVEINATFPGVTTITDIEQAIIGLADNAYQYANKYKY